MEEIDADAFFGSFLCFILTIFFFNIEELDFFIMVPYAIFIPMIGAFFPLLLIGVVIEYWTKNK